MEEQLVSFQVAKLAKEKGFKELCFAAFHKNNRNDGYFESGIISQSEYFKFPKMNNGDKIAVLQKDYIHTILRPTQSLLQKWLREVHGIHICVDIDINDTWYFHIYDLNSKRNSEFDLKLENNKYKSYEEAMEIALFEALKLIKH